MAALEPGGDISRGFVDEKLAEAIREVLETGKADIYYDPSFDTPADIEEGATHTTGVERHQSALKRLSEAFSGQSKVFNEHSDCSRRVGDTIRRTTSPTSQPPPNPPPRPPKR